MGKHVPHEILERYSTYEESVFIRPFYTIDPKYRDVLVKAMSGVGFEVEERGDLEFW